MFQIKLIEHARKDLDKLPKNILNRVLKEFVELQNNPRSHGSIKLTQTEGYHMRAGDYRILYRIEDSDKSIFAYRIKHRKDAYR